MSQNVYLGEVMSVADEYNGNRIRVKISLDGKDGKNGEFPYAFPLLPKTLQTMPKKGEMVIVFLTDGDVRNATRFYIGPIISQYQKMYEDNKSKSIVDAPASLLPYSTASALETLNHFSSTFGSFPRVEDVALVGRKSEDVILKDDEINIRCGVRKNSDGSDNKNLIGDVIFNETDPAYIQLKYKRDNIGKKNFINLVGGGINLMSNADAQKITNYMKNLNNVNSYNKEQAEIKNARTLQDDGEDEEIIKEIYPEEDYNQLLTKLHQVPYGDVLVQVLEVMRNAILTHEHKWAQEPPTSTNVPAITLLKSWGQATDDSTTVSLKKILLSDTVRIS